MILNFSFTTILDEVLSWSKCFFFFPFSLANFSMGKSNSKLWKQLAIILDEHKPSLVLFLMCVKLLFNLMWQQWNTEQHNTLCPCSIHVFCLMKHLCTHYGILYATEFFFQGCKTKWPICFSFSLVKNPSERADLKSLMVGLYTSRLPNKNNNYYH